MIIFNLLGGIGIVLILVASIMFRQMFKVSFGERTIESFVLLLTQSISGFNRRVVAILFQLMFASNILMLILMFLKDKVINVVQLVVFDATLILFSILIMIMLKVMPQSISFIFSQRSISLKNIVQRILIAGFFQSFAFFGVFTVSIYIILSLVNTIGLISYAFGVLVVSFYYRSAGGVFKAAAETSNDQYQQNKVLTHPTQILSQTGITLPSVGGYFLDIFSSWIISIASFFAYVYLASGASQITAILVIPEVQWVFYVIVATGISLVASLSLINKNNIANLFLEIGYLAVGLSYVQIMIATYILPLSNKPYYYLFITVALVLMLGIAFFTNYLTASHYKPVRFIAKQAQFGGSNVLISSFFNGMIGSAIFLLSIVAVLFSIYHALNELGLILIIIYALSIAVIACGIKVFSVITNQVVTVIEHDEQPIATTFNHYLKDMSYTLIAIGNSFSSVAGLLSSLTILVVSVSFITKIDAPVDFLFGLGIGIVIIAVFYGLSISGTYLTLTESAKEVSRQLKEIPHILEKHKSHPNIVRLSDRHSINSLKSLTLPGSWILVSLSFVYLMISQQGVYGALVGMFMAVLIQGSFWSLFGDTVSACFKLFKTGLYGGSNTTSFNQLEQAFYYAHYFQWVLAPSGVIIMKFVGIISILMLLI